MSTVKRGVRERGDRKRGRIDGCFATDERVVAATLAISTARVWLKKGVTGFGESPGKKNLKVGGNEEKTELMLFSVFVLFF